ncbi:MAG: ABC transporter ATP-binding protein [Actinomycetota bacterium]
MTRALEVRGVSLRFGGVQALHDVSLDVGEWEIVGLIGPNGAGKTTFFNVVTGISRPDDGRVSFLGRDVTRMPTHRRVRLGMGRTWQNLGVVRTLTVLDNLMTAQHAHVRYGPLAGLLGTPGSFLEERELKRNAEEILDFLGLLEMAEERVGELPYGTQKLCDLAMALATDPRILLLDEPSSGMGPEEAHRLGDTLRYLRDALNLTILMIEHHVPLVVGVCDYVYVLSFGELLAAGEPSQIQRHPDVIAAYLGEVPGEPSAAGEPPAPGEHSLTGEPSAPDRKEGRVAAAG